MQSNIEIIDPHIHLWDPYTNPKLVSPLVKLLGRFPKVLDKVTRAVMPKTSVEFVGLADYVLQRHLPEIYHQDTGKYEVKGYVHIQAGWETKKPLGVVGETEWLMSLDKKPLAIVGEAHLHDLKNLDAVLEAHAKASPQFRGIRDMVAEGKGVMEFKGINKPLQSDDFKKGFARLGERNLTFDAFLYADDLPDFTKLVAEVPETKVVLDHVGTPIGAGGSYAGRGTTQKERDAICEKWYEDLTNLAAVPHVKMKLSGLLMPILGYGFHFRRDEITLGEVVDAIGPHLEFALKTFGVDRCMFASNFPMDKVSVTFEMLYDAYFQIMKSYSIEEKQKVFSKNALSFYSII